jgi:hypothetical protein
MLYPPRSDRYLFRLPCQDGVPRNPERERERERERDLCWINSKESPLARVTAGGLAMLLLPGNPCISVHFIGSRLSVVPDAPALSNTLILLVPTVYLTSTS